MSHFPTQLLHITNGLFGPHPMDGYFMRVSLAPFELEGALIETSARLDGVHLPTNDLNELADHSLNFQINPDAGYIDGSIYMDGAHHPVDVRQIIFGKMDADRIEARFVTEIDFAFEGLGDYAKTPWTFSVMLAWTDEAQNA